VKRLLVGVILCAVLAGCGDGPTYYRSADSGGPILPAAEGDVEYIEDSGVSRLLIRADGVTVLATSLHGNLCGELSGFPPAEYQSGPPFHVNRAFVGASALPVAGDTLGGKVVLSTEIDTITVRSGRFFFTCLSPDTLEGYAWVKVATGGECKRDSLVRPMRLIRKDAP